MNENPRCDVSIVVPVRSEAGSVGPLAREIEDAFRSTRWTWECLWVDDGSRDGTLSTLKELHRREPRHRFISLERNCGQSAALAVGWTRASGLVLATLDGDLQNDPADLPRMLEELEHSSVDMVQGVRVHRQDGGVRRFISRLANGFRNRVTGVSIADAGCATRVFYRECIDGIPVFGGMHRFLPTLVEVRGYHVRETPVGHRRRPHGRSRYGVHDRVWVGILDTLWVAWFRRRRAQAAVAVDSDLMDLLVPPADSHPSGSERERVESR